MDMLAALRAIICPVRDIDRQSGGRVLLMLGGLLLVGGGAGTPVAGLR